MDIVTRVRSQAKYMARAKQATVVVRYSIANPRGVVVAVSNSVMYLGVHVSINGYGG